MNPMPLVEYDKNSPVVKALEAAHDEWAQGNCHEVGCGCWTVIANNHLAPVLASRAPAESTASDRQAFEEWWRSEGCTHLPAASEPPQHAYVAQKAWQARGASQYERGRRDGLEQAAQECDRHAKFCHDEAHKGGDFTHLIARSTEATYNAVRIRNLAATSGTPAPATTPTPK